MSPFPFIFYLSKLHILIFAQIRFMEEDIFGINAAPSAVTEELEERVELIIHKLKFFPEKPKVACITEINPIALSSSRISNSITIAGGLPLENLAWKELQAQNPAIIIIMLKGYTIQETMTEIHHFITLPHWADLDAVKNNRVYIADSEHYFETEGEKAIDALEAIAEMITPKYFNFGFEGKTWIKFEV